jgi:hypothetical protein
MNFEDAIRDTLTHFSLMSLTKLANSVLSDTANITYHHLINGTCQLSYQHLTFIMLNDIVLDIKITGV